jgi:hypothetical protein
MAGAESGAPAATELPSIRVGSFARLLGLGARLLIGTASAVVTARLLGPSQKGTLSSLLYVVTLLSYGCALGLGQAGTVLAGRGEVDRSRALQISIFSVGATSVGGMVLLAATAWVADWSAITTAVVLAAVFLPVMSLAYVFTAFVNSLERLVLTSGAAVVAALVGLLATALFVGPLQLGVAGGVAGNAVSAAVITCGLGLVLHRSGLRLTPAFELRTVRRLLGFGLPVEAAHLLAALAERVDLLIVYALADERAAGSYAVALTLGRLSVYTANAIAGAAFPRLAILGDNDARRLVPRAARLATVTAVGSSVVLVAVLPHSDDPSPFRQRVLRRRLARGHHRHRRNRVRSPADVGDRCCGPTASPGAPSVICRERPVHGRSGRSIRSRVGGHGCGDGDDGFGSGRAGRDRRRPATGRSANPRRAEARAARCRRTGRRSPGAPARLAPAPPSAKV